MPTCTNRTHQASAIAPDNHRCANSARLIAVVSLVIGCVSGASSAFAKHVDPVQYMSAGDGYAQGGQYAKALDSYSKGSKAAKNNPAFYQKKANVEMQMRRYKEAVRDYSKALSLNPQDSDSLSSRAKAYDSLSLYQKEMKDVERLLNLQAPVGVNLLWHAKLAERFKDSRQVIDDCDKAIGLGLERDQLADLYQLRARAFKKLGKKTESAQELAKYQTLAPAP